jgi:hypothetical protein
MTQRQNHRLRGTVEEDPPGGEMAEVTLEIPLAEVTALEEMARRRGVSTGYLLRRLVQIFLACMAESEGGNGKKV